MKINNSNNNNQSVPAIFIKKMSDEHKIIPLNSIRMTLGPTRHFPPATQEWFNSIYTYNNNSMKNVSIADKNLINLIKSYFNLHLNKSSLIKLDKRLSSKPRPTRLKRLSLKKIFISKAELKHTNSKVVITIYVYNEERRVLMSKLRKIEQDFSLPRKKRYGLHSNNLENSDLIIERDKNIFEKGRFAKDLEGNNLKDFLLSFNPPRYLEDKIKYFGEDFLVRLRYILSLPNKLEFLNEFLARISFVQLLDMYKTMITKEKIKNEVIVAKNKRTVVAEKKLRASHLKYIKINIIKLKNNIARLNKFKTLIESNKLLYDKINRDIYPSFVLENIFLAPDYKNIFENKYLLTLNQKKFHDEYLFKLKTLIQNIYNKEIEFNFVNLKNIYLNSDLFVQAISTKIKNRKNSLLRVLKNSVKMVKLPDVNKVKDKYKKIAVHDLWVNKVKNLKINSFIPNSNIDVLNQLIFNLFPSSSSVSYSKNINTEKEDTKSIQSKVLNSLKYKTMEGIRLEASGRLTKRFTASRSVFKLKWKGSLKNVDSSFRGWSTPILRGHVKPNVQYSLINSKTRNGAFGLKGWIGGK